MIKLISENRLSKAPAIDGAEEEVKKPLIDFDEDDEDDIQLTFFYEIVLLHNVINQDGYFDEQYYFAYTYFKKAKYVYARCVESIEVNTKQYNMMQPPQGQIDDGATLSRYLVEVTYPHPDELYVDYDY